MHLVANHDPEALENLDIVKCDEHFAHNADIAGKEAKLYLDAARCNIWLGMLAFGSGRSSLCGMWCFCNQL